ncbi:DMP19 family protein [Sulfitobacter sp. S223]|uniref:DMP19 family protein n=1 Tax=Sulfitobacter sp. S223 TaxID=2867023 RepID=UPI0021A8E627|nr:DMP19 family protein [Sulfitobacter sp. S223]UWR27469.1 DMP19 family protein [Sulfitobacter sp. S223]
MPRAIDMLGLPRQGGKPRLAPDYFDRLLTDTDPVDAVAALSAFWQPRIDSRAARFGLSVAEYNVHLILIYTGEIADGGHAQYFVNRGVAYVDDTIAALNAVGLETLGDVLAQAQSILAVAGREFADCDAAADEKLPEVDVVLLRYCRAHKDTLLLPERGLLQG